MSAEAFPHRVTSAGGHRDNNGRACSIADRNPALKDTPKSAKSSATARDTTLDSFTDEERGAMKERARELRAARRSGPSADADGEADVLAKIAEMPEPDRVLVGGCMRSSEARIGALVQKAVS
jgi:hypothetical protein